MRLIVGWLLVNVWFLGYRIFMGYFVPIILRMLMI